MKYLDNLKPLKVNPLLEESRTIENAPNSVVPLQVQDSTLLNSVEDVANTVNALN